MKRRNRLWIVLGAAAITFATLQVTLGSEYRNHARYEHKWNGHCGSKDQNTKADHATPAEKK
jgi:hypothetical protein